MVVFNKGALLFEWKNDGLPFPAVLLEVETEVSVLTVLLLKKFAGLGDVFGNIFSKTWFCAFTDGLFVEMLAFLFEWVFPSWCIINVVSSSDIILLLSTILVSLSSLSSPINEFLECKSNDGEENNSDVFVLMESSDIGRWFLVTKRQTHQLDLKIYLHKLDVCFLHCYYYYYYFYRCYYYYYE